MGSLPKAAVQVSAVAYDNPIPGFQTNNTINLRLWAAKPDREFDLQAFNTGDYVQVAHLSARFTLHAGHCKHLKAAELQAGQQLSRSRALYACREDHT